MRGRSAKAFRRAQKQSAASSTGRSLRQHNSREGEATKARPKRASGLGRSSIAAPINRCLQKNGKDGSTDLQRGQKSSARCETTFQSRRAEGRTGTTMRWPRLFADATYRNPRIWTWREWLTVLALG